MSEESNLSGGCHDGKEHVSSEGRYEIPMRRQGRIILIDTCGRCKNSYEREPTEQEIRKYEEFEKFLRQRGFDV